MSAAAQSHEIPRVECPTREQFEREFLDHRKPCILTGVVEQWPAFEKWTPEYLKATGGSSEVTVRFDEGSDHFNYYTPAGRHRNVPMTFGAFLDGISAEPPDKRYYLTEYAVRSVSEDLMADLDAEKYMDWSHPVFFIGRETYSPTHYHGNHEAFLCQIAGRKIVHMYPPEQFRCFYAYPWYSPLLNFARVDERQPDLSKFPRFERAVPIRVELEPGEMMFIPIHWWHSVQSVELGISVTLFWPAKRKSYHFPSPGLQVYAHHFLAPGSIAMRARKVARKLLRR